MTSASEASDDQTGEPREGGGFGSRGRILGLILGPIVAAALLAIGPPEGLAGPAWTTVALLALMIVWWVTEAIPISATALLPLLVLPLAGVTTPAEAAAPYADPILFLFIAGFMIAVAIERWNLHARIALHIAASAGGQPAALIGGFILAAGLLSMWISNTATALMLTPIAVGVADAMARQGRPDPALGAGLVLGVAYAASIGGMGTPVGSPTNLIAMAFLNERGIALSFGQWMTLGVPVVIILLPTAWFLLTREVKRVPAEEAQHGRTVLRTALAALGPMSRAEVRVGAVFLLVALGWMLREVLNGVPGLERLSDMGVAVAGALALFLLPSGAGAERPRLLDWSAAERIPWGIVILFGGGLSVAGAMESTGLSDWLASALGGLRAFDVLLIVAALILVTLVATEAMSNVATLTAMLPVVAAFAAALGVNPLLLVFPVSIAASLGFMLPIATGPNAIAYATGRAPLRRMLRQGMLLNLAGVLAILLVNATLAGSVLG